MGEEGAATRLEEEAVERRAREAREGIVVEEELAEGAVIAGQA